MLVVPYDRIAKAKCWAKLGLVNRGDTIARQQGPLVATYWLDNKVNAVVLSTNVQPDVMTQQNVHGKTVQRWRSIAQWQLQHRVKR